MSQNCREPIRISAWVSGTQNWYQLTVAFLYTATISELSCLIIVIYFAFKFELRYNFNQLHFMRIKFISLKNQQNLRGNKFGHLTLLMSQSRSYHSKRVQNYFRLFRGNEDIFLRETVLSLPYVLVPRHLRWMCCLCCGFWRVINEKFKKLANYLVHISALFVRK
jgi:hypothetical protein